MKTKAVAALAAFGLLAGGSLWALRARKPVAPPPVEKKDITVAQVGAKRIMLDQFEKENARYLAILNVDKPQGQQDDIRIKKIVLDKMIEELFLEEEADRRKVTVDDAELSREISQLLGVEEEKERARNMATRNNITMEEWREKVRRSMRIKKLLMAEVDSKVYVDEAEAQTYFKENKDSFKWPERVRALQIMTRDGSLASQIQKEIQVKRLERDHKTKMAENFANMAREKSVSPDAARGGDLGFFARGQMPKEFDDTVFALKEGQVSEVVESAHGFHIFMVIKRDAPRQMTFDEAKEKIILALRDNKREKEFSDWIERLKKETRIMVFSDVLLRPGS